MDKNDYKNKIEEHRKPINLDGEESSDSRMSRRTANQPVKHTNKSRNYLLPILFAIFILIPFGFLIYIQAFYKPNQNETAVLETGVFEYKQNDEETEEIGGTDEVDEPATNKEDESETNKEDESQNTDEVIVEDDTKAEESPSEITPVEEPVEEEQPSEKTHIVQPNETLYRIAMNYYNSADAVEKIKEANGLTSDTISSGQKLILP